MSYLHGEPVKLQIFKPSDHLSEYLSGPEDEENGVGIRAWFQGSGLLLWSTDTPLIKLALSRPRIPSRLCSMESGATPSYSDEGITAMAAIINGRLADCRERHAECDTAVSEKKQNQPDRSPVPTRLVGVGKDGDEMFPRVLHNNEENPVTEPSASNIAQIIESVDWTRLPKTIQEAIVFTRKLGVRNSPLTIAATGAADSANGLFLQRPGLTFQPQPLTLQQRTAEGTLTIITIFPSMPSRLSEIFNSPRALRGWAAQERILSTRVVHFATNSVEGECESSRATEVYPAGLHPDNESHG
ncbi:hypothetical protein GQ607_017729 [Colletotrichum asianum]|uniref:Uncharacterized protein n=1 Tax=Colletotrichum asianum TaxID=702518 RepID=A0A8H3ZD20_9PEZI|nr:hypothetical protein GQ607_017729 [Colletotrichum asianum]